MNDPAFRQRALGAIIGSAVGDASLRDSSSARRVRIRSSFRSRLSAGSAR